MRILIFLLLLSQAAFCQPTFMTSYRSKIVYDRVLDSKGKMVSFKLDTINYPYSITVKFTSRTANIGEYGVFLITKYDKTGDYSSVFHHYILTGGMEVTVGEKVMYLLYPTINKKSKSIIFELDKTVD